MNSSSPLVVLSGGYLEWLQTYPMLCTKPEIVHEVQNTVLNDILDLGKCLLLFMNTTKTVMNITTNIQIDKL